MLVIGFPILSLFENLFSVEFLIDVFSTKTHLDAITKNASWKSMFLYVCQDQLDWCQYEMIQNLKCPKLIGEMLFTINSINIASFHSTSFTNRHMKLGLVGEVCLARWVIHRKHSPNPNSEYYGKRRWLLMSTKKEMKGDKYICIWYVISYFVIHLEISS